MSVLNRLIASTTAALAAGALTAVAVPAANAAVMENTNAPAVADPEATPVVPGDAAKAQTRRYCIEDQITGSRITHKMCKTKAEWLKEGVDIDHPEQ